MGMARKAEKKPKGKRPQEQEFRAPTSVDGKELRGIVRIAGKDLKGHWKLTRALQTIKGLGPSIGKVLSKSVIIQLSLTNKTLVGELSEKQVEQIEQIISNPSAQGVPDFMLNRQRDYVGGKPHHLISTDLAYAIKQDIDHEKDSQTWKGYRHSYGQPVRGQRTRTTGRKGMSVGVMKKTAKAGAAAAAAATGADKGKEKAEKK